MVRPQAEWALDQVQAGQDEKGPESSGRKIR